MANVGKLHEAITAAGVTVTSVRNSSGTLTAVYPGGTSQGPMPPRELKVKVE